MPNVDVFTTYYNMHLFLLALLTTQEILAHKIFPNIVYWACHMILGRGFFSQPATPTVLSKFPEFSSFF